MKLKLLVLVLALQTAWLLGMVVMQEHALVNGKIILLETKPVDPRDMLSGDYLMLNYKISDVPVSLFSPPIGKELPYGTKIFVAVAPGTNGFYMVTHASTNEMGVSANEVLLLGKSSLWWRNFGGFHSNDTIHVEYGLERYYIAEGTGNPAGKLTVKAIVPASGRAKIKEVLVNGKPYSEIMKPDGD